ncbi:MAG: thiamine-monophosphate kinase, partial [Chloroflexi bacterium]|nr:thiamine-monophosphate kinase [Chloroflexota bacterium]
MDVSQLGEFGLIERLTRIVGAEGSPDLIIGPGDDAAVWRVGSEYLIATTDAMVEGVHFLPERARWEDVGWKALAANVSDIAAMGGTPLFALVTLALPPETPAETMDALYRGLGESAREYGIAIAGGDVV